MEKKISFWVKQGVLQKDGDSSEKYHVMLPIVPILMHYR